ncbi:MAG TPA: amino acid adenylation domain-containing protein [Herpetosiphonaceae bacterium]
MDTLDLPAQIAFAPYNQVFQQLLDPGSALASNHHGVNLLLIRWEDWRQFEKGSALADERTVDLYTTIEQNARQFVHILKAVAERTSARFLVCVCPPTPTTDARYAALCDELEAYALAELADAGNVWLLSGAEIQARYPVVNYYDRHSDELGHIPFTPVFFTALGTTIARKIYAFQHPPYKVVVLDCDHTLWKGVCGEDGALGITLDEARLALQRFVVALHDAGMLICLCSKNNEDDVVEVFEQRGDMLLTREHIVSWRINWTAKSENLKALAEELQLGLDSFIFIDDNPLECAEVQAHCPDVLTLQLPEDPSQIPQFLNHVWAFDRLKITAEDAKRTDLYKQNIARERARTAALTLEDFLVDLALKIEISPLTAQALPRVAQLTQRTNQFNLTTIRRSEGEIQAFCRSGAGECLVVEVSDRFGDYGLVGVILFKTEAAALVVDTLLLSCRVLGKRVEHQMLARLGQLAQERGLSTVRLHYVTTKKNQPARDFLESIGGEFKTQTADGAAFDFPSDGAETIASRLTTVQLAPQRDVLIEPTDMLQPARQPIATLRTKTSLMQRIAADLHSAEQIHRAIEERQRRTRDDLDGAFVAPRYAAEERLSRIWADVLSLDRVGIHDNFFSLGGQSLLGTRLLSRVRDTFNVALSQGALFEAPTVAELHALIERARGEQAGSADHTQPILALPRQEPTTSFPLSFAQQRLWFLDQLQSESVAYNDVLMLRLIGAVDVAVLEDGLNAIVRRHETLRTTFPIHGSEAVQMIGPAQRLALSPVDLRQIVAEQREAALVQRAHQELERRFDLADGPLFRATLFRLSADEHVLLLCAHHIISDGWSWGVLCRELSAYYRSAIAKTPVVLPDLPIQYADYSVWQRDYLQAGVLQAELDYWRQQLADLTALELPTDHPRPAISSPEGASLVFTLPAALSAELATFSQREGVTLFMTLLSTFQVMLARYTYQTDIAVGTPIANRTRQQIEGLIGFFVNTLVIRSRFEMSWTFRDLLRHVREVAVGAYAHQDVPFEQVVDAVQPERDLSRHPLFQVMFVLQNEPLSPLALPDVTVQRFNLPSTSSKFDLTLTLEETAAGLSGHIEFCTALFERETIERLAGHFQTLLHGIVAEPTCRIADLPLLTATERERLLRLSDLTEPTYAVERCIHELVEEHAARQPEAVALVYENQRLTYGALNARANQLAHYLRKQGTGPEARVGLYVERSLEMVIGVLGILKAGGAYVPIDRSYPLDRLQFMLDDAQVSVVLTQQDLSQHLAGQTAQVVCLDTEWQQIAQESAHNPVSETAPGNLAYVIYTSGSTGRPKGVLVTHANVLRLLAATDDWFHFGAQDVWTLFHSIAFDFSVWELWGALCYGGRLVVVPYWVSRSPEAFYDLVGREQVTVLNQTPSAFRQFIQAETLAERLHDLALRYVIFGGEALNLASLQPWYERHSDRQPLLVNMYGITETTVHVTYRPVSAADAYGSAGSVIGGPIPDLQLYVLDAQLQPVPIGVAGEIYVGGAGVARGYLNRPALTAERFVPDPFSRPEGTRPGARLYRSGDLARHLANGDIEYLGRIDQQVKIRGFRIELGEIEAVLRQHEAVQDAVVVVREERLVAYVVTNKEQRNKEQRTENGPADDSCSLFSVLCSPQELRALLGSGLPDYMVPSAFVFLDALPLTVNGKLNRKALPAPDSSSITSQATFVAPRTPAEEVVAQIWSRLLHVERVGVTDNFFDLGGNSLLATQALVRLHDVFQIKVSVRSLFDSPTIAGLVETMAELWGDPEGPQALNEIATLYQQLEQLSEDEVRAMLSSQS